MTRCKKYEQFSRVFWSIIILEYYAAAAPQPSPIVVMVRPHQQCRPGISIFQTAHRINRSPNEPSDKSKTAHKSRSTATPADRPSKSKTKIQYENPKGQIQRTKIPNTNSN